MTKQDARKVCATNFGREFADIQGGRLRDQDRKAELFHHFAIRHEGINGIVVGQDLYAITYSHSSVCIFCFTIVLLQAIAFLIVCNRKDAHTRQVGGQGAQKGFYDVHMHLEVVLLIHANVAHLLGYITLGFFPLLCVLDARYEVLRNRKHIDSVDGMRRLQCIHIRVRYNRQRRNEN